MQKGMHVLARFTTKISWSKIHHDVLMKYIALGVQCTIEEDYSTVTYQNNLKKSKIIWKIFWTGMKKLHRTKNNLIQSVRIMKTKLSLESRIQPGGDLLVYIKTNNMPGFPS